MTNTYKVIEADCYDNLRSFYALADIIDFVRECEDARVPVDTKIRVACPLFARVEL